MADIPQKVATAQLAALGTEPNSHMCELSLHLNHSTQHLRLTIYRTPPIPKPAAIHIESS